MFLEKVFWMYQNTMVGFKSMERLIKLFGTEITSVKFNYPIVEFN